MNFITNHLDSLLETTHAHVYLKDTKGRYLECNRMFFQFNKVQLNDIKGKTDADLFWKKQAPILSKNDTEIIHRNIVKTFVESVQVVDNEPLLHFVSNKAPLLSRDGKIIGVTGISFMADVDNLLFRPDQSLTQDPKEQLTLKQADCLYYLVKGMTIKQIGQKLNLSPRTVEDHLNVVKSKHNCHNRAELIAMALQLPIIRNKL